MATGKSTGKRAASGTPGKRSNASKAAGSTKKRTGRGASSTLRERFRSVRERVPGEVVGLVLIGAGLFFTAAFLSGMGAFLGDAGRFAATRLFGVVGLALAPLAVLAGLALLFGRFSWRRFGGAALVFGALCATLAARLPEAELFQASSYSGAGGLLGSAGHAGVYALAGPIGVAIFLAAVYLAGLSLLTGISPAAAYTATRSGLGGLRARFTELSKERALARRERLAEPAEEPEETGGHQGGRERKEEPRAQGVDELYAELEDGLAGREAAAPEKEPGESPFEVVLPKTKKRGQTTGAEVREFVSGEYTPPPFSLLDPGTDLPDHDAGETSRRLTQALADLGVEATVVRAVVGPRVTRYELRLGSGVKVGKVSNLQQDIAYALAATEVRILAPIPGKSAVGVEVPNLRPAKVTLGDVFEEYPEHNDWALPVGIGKDIAGRPVFMNLAEMPHLLVAGTTGSGKSVMLNGMLTSLLLTTDPRQVKMVLIDPKRVEMAPFARIPHLITPVVTDVKKAANALAWAVAEMERRYEVLEKMGVRSLDGYNAKADTEMPYVVIVIDELADLMMTSAAKVEDAVIRIAQKARAVGIHLVVATQRPSVDVITGMIKANVPSRIAFAVSSQVDSRVILDTPGAEALLGMGDMLFKPVSASRPSRVQGAFISEAEVERVVDATVEASRGSVRTEFIEEVVEPKAEPKESEEPEDDLVPEAANFVVSTQQASVSAVQRRFRVGYSRAGRIIDALERKGVVGPYEGSKSRSVVASEADLASIFNWDGAGGPKAPSQPELPDDRRGDESREV